MGVGWTRYDQRMMFLLLLACSGSDHPGVAFGTAPDATGVMVWTVQIPPGPVHVLEGEGARFGARYAWDASGNEFWFNHSDEGLTHVFGRDGSVRRASGRACDLVAAGAPREAFYVECP